MKRLSLIFVVLILISSTAFAYEVGEMKFGIMGGLNMSNVRAEGVSADWYYLGAGGVFMKYQVNEMFQIQPEAMFKMRGWKEAEGGLELTNKVNYIDIDFIGRLTIPSESNIKGSIGIGAYAGFKISDSYDINVALTPEAEEEMDAIYENLKSYDIGLIFSGAVDFVLQNGGAIILDVRYELGLMKIFDEFTFMDIPVALEYKNQAIQVFVGYGF